MGAGTDFLVQSGAGLIGGAGGFGFAYWIFRIQRAADIAQRTADAKGAEKTAKSAAETLQRGLLTYLAAEVRRNYHMAMGLVRYCQRASTYLASTGKGRAVPYLPAAMSDEAYHACLGNPAAQMEHDKELLSALVDCYSAIPVWRSLEQSWFHETHSGDSKRVQAALAQAIGKESLLEGQAERFLNIYNMLIQRGVAAEEVPLDLLGKKKRPKA